MALLNPKKKPEPTRKIIFLNALGKTWTEFAQITSIQGVKYTADPDTNVYFRLLWLIVVLSMFICANVMVATFYFDFISNPTRINVETNQAPLPELKFPAVTICNLDVIYPTKAETFLKNLTYPPNITFDEVYKYIPQLAGMLLEIDISDVNVTQLNLLQNVADLNRYSIAEFLANLRPNCDELLFRCRWQMELIECKNLFSKSKTYNGECCSFNAVQPEITLNLNKYANHAGIRGGLSVIITPMNDKNAISVYNTEGFQVFIHVPEEYPCHVTVDKIVPSPAETFIRVRPEVITCSSQVEQLSIKDRGCAFPNEIKLQYFEKYNQNNCEMECFLKQIIYYCDCIPYYFWTLSSDKKVCDFNKIPCIQKNYDAIHIQKSNPNYNCECPANCNDLYFDVVNGGSGLKNGSYHTVAPFYNDINYTAVGIAHIYMESQTYIKLRSDLLSNIISLAANFGSAYSLFLGISIVSIIEFLYFFTAVIRRNYYELLETHEKVSSFVKNIDKPNIRQYYYPNIIQVQPNIIAVDSEKNVKK